MQEIVCDRFRVQRNELGARCLCTPRLRYEHKAAIWSKSHERPWLLPLCIWPLSKAWPITATEPAATGPTTSTACAPAATAESTGPPDATGAPHGKAGRLCDAGG